MDYYTQDTGATDDVVPVDDDVMEAGENRDERSGRSASLPPASSILHMTRRICQVPDCHSVLPDSLHDPHTVCIRCRGFCSIRLRCNECKDWEKSIVESAYIYQLKLKDSALYKDNELDNPQGTYLQHILKSWEIMKAGNVILL